MLNTPRRAISYPNPDRTDRADIALHISTVALAADQDVLFQQGTDAARVAAPHQANGGKFWWATDTLLLWYDDGANWRQVQTPQLSVPNLQAANYVLALADSTKTVEMNVAAANTLTVPTNAAIGFPVGTTVNVAQLGAGQTSIVPAGGVTLRSYGNMLKLAGQYALCSLIKRGADDWWVSGNLVP
jgi:hypothetical protein